MSRTTSNTGSDRYPSIDEIIKKDDQKVEESAIMTIGLDFEGHILIGLDTESVDSKNNNQSQVSSATTRGDPTDSATTTERGTTASQAGN